MNMESQKNACGNINPMKSASEWNAEGFAFFMYTYYLICLLVEREGS